MGEIEPSEDPMTTVIKASVDSFFKTIAGPLAELSAWGAELIRRQRFRTAVKTLEMAERMIAERGLSGKVIPSKTLAPLLEYASLEDEDDQEMQTRWAALLANAATADAPNEVPPAFPRILAEITSAEARLLEMLYEERGQEMSLDTFRIHAGRDWRDPSTRIPSEARLDNLQRLQLITVNFKDETVERLREQLEQFPGATWENVGLTAMGTAFVQACSPPGASDE